MIKPRLYFYALIITQRKRPMNYKHNVNTVLVTEAWFNDPQIRVKYLHRTWHRNSEIFAALRSYLKGLFSASTPFGQRTLKKKKFSLSLYSSFKRLSGFLNRKYRIRVLFPYIYNFTIRGIIFFYFSSQLNGIWFLYKYLFFIVVIIFCRLLIWNFMFYGHVLK